MPGQKQVTTARTPEELETLFEDSLIIPDPEAVTDLFEQGAVLVVGDKRTARGADEAGRLALAVWRGNNCYVADPQRITQARDVALIITTRGTNVARRSQDGAWRYAIVIQSIDGENGRTYLWHRTQEEPRR
jgi:hypothetical protein